MTKYINRKVPLPSCLNASFKLLISLCHLILVKCYSWIFMQIFRCQQVIWSFSFYLWQWTFISGYRASVAFCFGYQDTCIGQGLLDLEMAVSY